MPDRIAKLQQLMIQDGVDGVLYATSGNMQYFLDDLFFWQRTTDTGGGKTAADWHLNGHFFNKPDCLLFIPAEGEAVLVLTYDKCDAMGHIPVTKRAAFFPMLADELRPLLEGCHRIAVGESCQQALQAMVHQTDNRIIISDGEAYGEKLRMIKDAGEIAKLRQAAHFTDMAMGTITSALQEGVTPRMVQRLIAAIALDSGRGSISFNPAAIFVQSGAPGSEELFNYPPHAGLQEGTAIGFDFGYVVDGYCSDFGRSFYCGKNRQAREAYDALQEAQLYLLSLIKPGVSLGSTFATLHDKLEGHGLGKYLRRVGDFGIMGHQIGIDVHERPWLRSDEEAVFLPGMVLCIEPKIMWPGLCYLRVEDMVLITETGCESLTKYDRSHFEL
ncbi:MAG: Xaa-Pro peptidase family protein [Symbiobacteriaceae bacterium]|nr:Xaa-Pro peptidase family protein [Symbiobacteriaceae bacterium]